MTSTERFDYFLPQERIALYPAAKRSRSRLLVLGEGRSRREVEFSRLGQMLRANDVLVCNDSKVIRARLHGRKRTGGKVELLIERITAHDRALAQIKASGAPRVADAIYIDDEPKFEVRGRKDQFFDLQAIGERSVSSLLDEHGEVPLPPYISRPAEESDLERYQTVYARLPGSVAAPTAGLHFSKKLISSLKRAGVGIEFITLHVGAGTFAPIRGDDCENHRLHSERCEISEETCERIAAAKSRGGRVVAVGTTVTRALETASSGGSLRPYRGDTGLFIKPGFEFRAVDVLITNFHLPRSTLLMLVCAFAGTERVLDAYRYAVDNGFRFYSYGDAMIAERLDRPEEN